MCTFVHAYKYNDLTVLHIELRGVYFTEIKPNIFMVESPFQYLIEFQLQYQTLGKHLIFEIQINNQLNSNTISQSASGQPNTNYNNTLQPLQIQKSTQQMHWLHFT